MWLSSRGVVCLLHSACPNVGIKASARSIATRFTRIALEHSLQINRLRMNLDAPIRQPLTTSNTLEPFPVSNCVLTICHSIRCALRSPRENVVTSVLLALPTMKEVHRSMCTNASLTCYLFNFCWLRVNLQDRDLKLHNKIEEKQTFST